MYELFIDRPTDFICEIAVKNADLKHAVARMVIKSDTITLLCEGKIENGKCIIPIRRLKGLLDENIKGKMTLEVIIEDTYFSPWHDEFLTEEHTSVKVKVNENKISSKPTIEVKIPIKSSPATSKKIPLLEISELCRKFGITKKTIIKRKSDLNLIIQEYFKINPEFISNKSIIISDLKNFIK